MRDTAGESKDELISDENWHFGIFKIKVINF